MSAARVEQFLAEVSIKSRKRPAPSLGTSSNKQLLLPLHLHLDHGHKGEAREQLLWKLGDSSVVPAVAARAFCQQHISANQLEREVLKLQRSLEQVLEQHKDLIAAPASPTLVRLEVRVPLPHLACVFHDEPLWDLSAPRAACEGYVAACCNELGLGWHAHTLILRRMKDAIDAAAKDLATGKAQLVPALSSSDEMLSCPPSKLPRVVHVTGQQVQQLRDQVAAKAAAKRRAEQQGGASPGSVPGGAVKMEPKEEQQGAPQLGIDATNAAARQAGIVLKQEGKPPPAQEQQQDGEPRQQCKAQEKQSSGDGDMPDLPE